MKTSDVKWLLEQDVFHEDLDPIMEAIKAAGMGYKVVKYIPLGAPNNFYDYYGQHECVIPYGSINFTAAVSRETNWYPGVWGNRKHLECTHYYPRLGKFLLNSEYIMLPYGELKRKKHHLFNVLDKFASGGIFLRPNSPLKSFTGQVVSWTRFDEDVNRLGFYDVEPEHLVIASSMKEISREWRMIIVDGSVVAGSQYKEDTLTQIREEVPIQVWDFAQEVANEHRLDDAYVIDVGSYEGMLKLIEVNSFSSSGWYLADKPSIVNAAAKLAVKQYEEHYS